MRITKTISVTEEQASQFDTDLKLVQKTVNLPANDSLTIILAVGRWADEIRGK